MNLFIFDLDETLIDEDEKLIVSTDALNLLKELYNTGEYEYGIASFNNYTEDILELLNIKYLFKYISSGILLPDRDIHPYTYSKIDNVIHIMNISGREYENIIFFDNNLDNCKHIRDYLKIPYIHVKGGVNYKNITESLDIVDSKKYKKIFEN